MLRRATVKHSIPLLIVAWMTSTGLAATYHVAQHAPNASDDNPGTQEQPWETISKAAKTMAAGDTVTAYTSCKRENGVTSK